MAFSPTFPPAHADLQPVCHSAECNLCLFQISKISTPIRESVSTKISLSIFRQTSGFILRGSAFGNTGMGSGLTGKSSLFLHPSLFQRFYSFVRKPAGIGQKANFLSHHRYFLSRRSNPLGNLYNFLSRMLSGTGQKANFLSHHRYFLSRQINPLGNLYNFLSRMLSGTGQKTNFLSRRYHFQTRKVAGKGKKINFHGEGRNFLF